MVMFALRMSEGAELTTAAGRHGLRQEALLALARLEKSDLSAALRVITELDARALGVERCSVWLFTEDRSEIVCHDLYLLAEDEHQRGARLHAREYPRYFAVLETTRTIAAHDARRDARTSEFTDGYLAPLGITSMLDVPVWLRGHVVGIVCHEHVGPMRRWGHDEEEFAASVADMVSLALETAERRRAEEARARALDDLRAQAAEAQRRAAELEGVLGSLVEAVWVLDGGGRVTYANDQARSLAGLVDGTGLRAGREERPLAPDERPTMVALRGGVVRAAELVLLEGSRRRFVRASAAPVRDAEGRIAGAVVTADDVSEQAEFERLKEQFITVAAHELKTPVTVVKGYAQALLRAKATLPAGVQEKLAAIGRGASRIDKIVGDLLDASRLQLGRLPLRLEHVDLGMLAAQVVSELAPMSPQHRLLVLPGAGAAVEADRGLLEQVLVNLVDNAVKYSPRGGEVEIALEREDGEVVVAVRDHGIGIPAEKQPRIGERFYRAHEGTPEDAAGLGIGLFVSREILARHGGRLTFESQEGQGSVFRAHLPAVRSRG